MKLAYITLGYPYPLTSGRLRQFHLVRQLRSRLSVNLICVSPKPVEDETRDALAEIAESVDYISSQGLDAAARSDRETTKLRLEEQIANACRAHAADGVFSMAGLPLACLPFGVAPLAVDFCDAEWFKVRERAKLARFPQSLRMHVRALRLRRYERQLARSSSHAFFAAARDAEHVLGGISTPYTVLPNGVDAEFWRRKDPQLGRETLLFAGAFSYQPNVDAASYLAQEILPLVRLECPDARLILAGRDPPEELRALQQASSNIEVTGFVPDIRTFYEQATVFLAPLRVAGGIQNKLLEALAMETPVITTSKGVAGLGLSDAERSRCALTVRDSTAELAQATIDVLQAQRETRQPVAANRAVVVEKFSWEHAAETLANVMDQLIAAS